MGYLHIENLYKSQYILLFRRCYALEKVHGTSAHVIWRNGQISYSSGGESHERFVALFDPGKLAAAFSSIGQDEVIVYGEAYGGRCQGMKHTYGPDLRFIVFDVQIGRSWLAVPAMAQIADALGLEAVPWEEIPTDIAALDAARDKPSEVAVRRGCGNDRPREGVVLRPLIEVVMNNGNRIIAKHKRETFSERATPQKMVDPEKLAVLEGARAIADEWVTEMRLTHVLDKFPSVGMEGTREVIAAMVEDIYREAHGEVVESREATRAIGQRTAELFKARLQARLQARLHEGVS